VDGLMDGIGIPTVRTQLQYSQEGKARINTGNGIFPWASYRVLDLRLLRGIYILFPFSFFSRVLRTAASGNRDYHISRPVVHRCLGPCIQGGWHHGQDSELVELLIDGGPSVSRLCDGPPRLFGGSRGGVSMHSTCYGCDGSWNRKGSS
jgi:hypothetical protein